MDVFSAVWETEVVPLLRREPSPQARTLLGDLQERHPQKFDDRLLRTLQRRVLMTLPGDAPEGAFVRCILGDAYTHRAS